MISILHVDDERSENTLLQHNLKSVAKEVELEWVGSAREAIDYLSSHRTDCVVSDYQMPEMDGMEFLQELKSKKLKIPFIFLTGQGSEVLASEALRAGADDYFTKDLGFAHFQRLANSIEKHIKRYKGERETERIKSKSRDQERNWELMLRNSTSGIALHKVVVDEQNRPVDYIYIEVNEEFEQQTSMIKNEIIGKRVTEVLPGIENGEYNWIEAFGNVAITGKSLNVEQYVEVLDRWYSVSAYSSEKGFFVTSSLNITDRKNAEEALRRSEERFRRLAENSPDMIYRMSIPDGLYEYVSPACLEIVGLSPEEIMKNPQVVADATHPDFLDYYKEHSDLLLKGLVAENYEYQIFHNKTGEKRWLSQRNVLIKDSQGKPEAIEAIVTDVTERKEISRAVKESEERFRAVFNNSEENILIWDSNLQISYINVSAAKKLELSPDSAIGKGMKEVFNHLPGFAEKWKPRIEEVLNSGGKQHFNDKDNANGRTILSETSLIPVFNDEKNRVVSVCLIHKDVSRHKQVERTLEILNEELLQANKDLDAFSQTVAHDLKAPLRHIDGFVSILERSCKEKLDEQELGFLKKIALSSQKSTKLIERILRFSKSASGEIRRGDVNLSVIAGSIYAGLKQQNPYRNVRFEIEDDIVVSGDEGLLSIALENLFRNAWKFSGKREEAVIRFGIKKGVQRKTLYVEDNGIGFSQEHAGALFAPFQRLHAKSEFRGTGIGLITVKRIIQRHGGDIWAEGKSGEGATFYFTLE